MQKKRDLPRNICDRLLGEILRREKKHDETTCILSFLLFLSILDQYFNAGKSVRLFVNMPDNSQFGMYSPLS